jgi:hypothetical protein
MPDLEQINDTLPNDFKHLDERLLKIELGKLATKET